MIILRHISSERNGFRLSISDLQIGPGVCVIQGPNGSGKSTLLKVILGLENGGPQAFQSILGQPVSERSRRSIAGQIGYLPQRTSMPSRWTVSDYLSYSAWLKGMSRQDALTAVRSRTAEFNIENLLDHRIRRLSGGQTRRVGLAQAMVASPRVLILDEPAAELDAKSRELLVVNIDLYARKGNCLVVVDHGALDIKPSWRTIVLDEGQLIEQ